MDNIAVIVPNTYNCNCTMSLGTVTPEEELWLEAAFDTIDGAPQEGPLLELLETAVPNLYDDGVVFWGFKFFITSGEPEGRIYALAENPNIDALISFLQLFLKEHRPKGVLSLEWGYAEDLVGGGGAAVVTAETFYMMNTEKWVADRLAELSKVL